jgi:hypothetical protein
MNPEQCNRLIAEKVMEWPDKHHTILAIANFDPYHNLTHAHMALEKYGKAYQLNGNGKKHMLWLDGGYIGPWCDTPSAAICEAIVAAVEVKE